MTAAAKAAAAGALGINVPAWRAGQRPAFNQATNGSTYRGQSCVLPFSNHNVDSNPDVGVNATPSPDPNSTLTLT